MELKVELLAKGINNAYLAYKHIVDSIFFECSVPLKFDRLQNTPDEELKARTEEVYKLYEALTSMEDAGEETFNIGEAYWEETEEPCVIDNGFDPKEYTTITRRKCSHCGESSVADTPFPYCPWCGSKMKNRKADKKWY